jgi:cytochrome oxidase assembly protein ShyY1
MSGSSLSFLLRPKWIAFHLLVAGSIAVMVWLSLWQFDRLHERREFNDLVTEQIEQQPAPFDAVLAEAGDDPASIEWRQVVVSGRYLDQQVIWFNRSQDGLAGDNVLSPLVTDGDDPLTVIVNRGFVPLGFDVAPAPTGDTELLARVRVPQERQRGELTDADTDGQPITEVRRIDLGQLAAQLPGEIAPVYLDLVDAVPTIAPTDPTPVPAPTLDEGPHLSYAVQWLIFALCVLIGWVLAVRRSMSSRRRGSMPSDADAVLRGATASPAPSGSEPPGDDEPANSTTGTASSSPR